MTAEAFVFIDKETRLPLRTEVNAESSGEVKGVNAARIVAEMRDIKTEVDAPSFRFPKGIRRWRLKRSNSRSMR